MKSLFVDLLLGLLLLGILSKFYTSAYATSLTTFGGSALLSLSHISLLFVLFYGLTIFAVNILVGASFIFVRNGIYLEAKLPEILLILLIPNLIFYLVTVLLSLSFMSLSYLSRSDKFVTYLGQLAGSIERTIPMLIGGLIVWRFN